MESYGSMEGSIVHMDRVGNDDDSYYSDRNRFYLDEFRQQRLVDVKFCHRHPKIVTLIKSFYYYQTYLNHVKTFYT